MRMFARKNKMSVSKGDEVVVINGKQKGTKGIVKNGFWSGCHFAGNY